MHLHAFKSAIPAAVALSLWTVASAETVAVPEGCTARATILKESCAATTIFDCGRRLQTQTFDRDRLVALTDFTPEWELIEFRYPEENSVRMRLEPGTGPVLDMDRLWATGMTESKGAFLLNTGVIKDRPYVMTGENRLTGEVELSGISFRVGQMKRVFERTAGTGVLEFEIDLYVSRDPDILIDGAWRRSVIGAGEQVFDQTPYAVVMPGKPGFLATRSERGCD